MTQLDLQERARDNDLIILGDFNLMHISKELGTHAMEMQEEDGFNFPTENGTN